MKLFCRFCKFVEEIESTINKFEKVSAFTVAELGKMLPPFIGIKKRVRTAEYWLHIERLSHGWWIWYSHKEDKLGQEKALDASEADARAKMLCYLIEQGIVKP